MRLVLALVVLVSPALAGPHLPPPTPVGAREIVRDRARDLTLLCAAQDPPVATISLTLYGSSAGLRVTSDTAGPFAACFAAHAGDPSFHADVAFATFLDLELPTIEQLAAERLAWLNVPEWCVPRPGPLPDTATIEIVDGTLHVTTRPSNDEVNTCLVRKLTVDLQSLLRVKRLHASTEKTVERRFSRASFINGFARTLERMVYDCPYNEDARSLKIKVTAPREASSFTISTVPARGTLATCVQQRLPAALVAHFTVDGYFRIDDDVNGTLPIHCGNHVCVLGI